MDLSDEEWKQLSQEYAILPVSGSHERSSSLGSEGDELLTDDEDGYSEDSDEFQETGLPLCCEKACLSSLPANEIVERQSWLQQMTKREQDISILALLVSGKSNKADANKTNAEVRTRFFYRFDRHHDICRRAFLFIYGIRETRLKRLQKLAASNALVPSLHGNVQREPVHILEREAVNRVLDFISNYATIHGLPDPGRLHRPTREIILPRSDTYISIWQAYKSGLRAAYPEAKGVGYDSFRHLWKQALAHIKFQGPRSDLCDLCDELKNHMRFVSSREDWQRLVREYETHYSDADAARTFYHGQIAEAKNAWQRLSSKTQSVILKGLSTGSQIREQNACARRLMMHYSFDFAQQVFYPYSSQQRGKAFFKTARKCQVFGVCAEALPRQVFFLIDESEMVGKGSSVVISLLDAFFRLHGLGEQEATLHADNCTGQNKNNYMMWYLMWRVMNGLHKRITLSFMIPGHTKFAPDRYFGLFKIKYRKSTIDSLEDVIKCVEDSTSDNKTIAQPYGQHLGLSSRSFAYRDWGPYLGKYFNPIDNVLKYNYFAFDANKPGYVEVRTKPGDQPRSLFLLKQKYMRFQERRYPPEVLPEGLSLERQTYLYKEIRGFIRDPKNLDLTCPVPSASQ